jgi:hypothetical protein
MDNTGSESRPMTVKATAGKLLLYIYMLQRSAPLDMLKRQIVFVDKQSRGVSLTSDKVWLAKDLLEINSNGSDIYNAFQFLLNQQFVTAQHRAVPNAKIYADIELTATGFNVIEDIERDDEGARVFRQKFNLEVEGGTNIDKVIDKQLSSLAQAN